MIYPFNVAYWLVKLFQGFSKPDPVFNAELKQIQDEWITVKPLTVKVHRN